MLDFSSSCFNYIVLEWDHCWATVHDQFSQTAVLRNRLYLPADHKHGDQVHILRRLHVENGATWCWPCEQLDSNFSLIPDSNGTECSLAGPSLQSPAQRSRRFWCVEGVSAMITIMRQHLRQRLHQRLRLPLVEGASSKMSVFVKCFRNKNIIII
jgi:hypothetical protein